MQFLRELAQLARRSEERTGAARVALPARFASASQPETSEPLALELDLPPVITSRAAPTASAVVSPASVSASLAPARARAEHEFAPSAVPAPPHKQGTHASASEPYSARAVTAQTSTEAKTISAARTLEKTTAPATATSVLTPRPIAPRSATPIEVSAQHTSAPVHEASPADGTRPPRDLLSPLELAARRGARAPLSEEAVASRASAAKPEHPVIQVTIDHIDVRAPAAPVAPARGARSRPAPSVSLSDYLRRGKRAGGTS